MSYTTNFYLTKHSLSGATVQYTPPIQANNMSEAMFMVNVEALIGSPTTASLTAAFQVSPIEYGGYNLDYQPSANQRDWYNVSSSDTKFGGLLDSDWGTLADQTLGASGLIHLRKINLGGPFLLRLALTPSFSGGSSPSFDVTVAATYKL